MHIETFNRFHLIITMKSLFLKALKKELELAFNDPDNSRYK